MVVSAGDCHTLERPNARTASAHFRPIMQSFDGSATEVFVLLHNQLGEICDSWLACQRIANLSVSERHDFAYAAPGLEWMLRQLLTDTIHLSIAAMLDPAQTRGRDNGSFLLLLARAKAAAVPVGDVDLLEQRVKEAQAASDTIRQRRNRRLAHTDLASTGSRDGDTRVPENEAQRALRSLAAALNVLAPHVAMKPRDYMQPGVQVAAMDALLQNVVRLSGRTRAV